MPPSPQRAGRLAPRMAAISVLKFAPADGIDAAATRGSSARPVGSSAKKTTRSKIDPEGGLIGRTEASGGTSYYLLYTPDRKTSREMSLETLKALATTDKSRNWVVYCEKIWLHQDQLRKFEQDHGKRIRPMLVPFQLK